MMVVESLDSQAILTPPFVPHPRLGLGDALLGPVHEGADGQQSLTLPVALIEELRLETGDPSLVGPPRCGQVSEVGTLESHLSGHISYLLDHTSRPLG